MNGKSFPPASGVRQSELAGILAKFHLATPVSARLCSPQGFRDRPLILLSFLFLVPVSVFLSFSLILAYQIICVYLFILFKVSQTPK